MWFQHGPRSVPLLSTYSGSYTRVSRGSDRTVKLFIGVTHILRDTNSIVYKRLVSNSTCFDESSQSFPLFSWDSVWKSLPSLKRGGGTSGVEQKGPDNGSGENKRVGLRWSPRSCGEGLITITLDETLEEKRMTTSPDKESCNII